MIRVLLAPDKFRGTFTAAQVCTHLVEGIREAADEAEVAVESLPLADGGEGTLDALGGALGATPVEIETRGPLGEPVAARYAVTTDGTAIIESALHCGLDLVEASRRDPLRASSYGVGEAIATALDAGARSFLLGLGGSATVDGGAGMAQALGYHLLDDRDRPLPPGAAELVRLARVDPSMAHPGLSSSRFTALCDVDNPLLGIRGAASVFGPQKGARPEDLPALEAGLAALAERVAGWKQTSARRLAEMRGAGAAGGLGLGASVFLGATLEPGAAFMLRALRFDRRLEACDLVVTGEGAFDAQTLSGKVVDGVLRAAGGAGRHRVVVTGQWDGSLPPGMEPGAVDVLTREHVEGCPGRLGPGELRQLGTVVVRIARRVKGLA